MAEDPIQHDKDFEPEAEPKSSKVWLNLINDAQKAFADYQHKADDIDRLYADLSMLANTSRDRKFQLFWSNCEVLKPSIYSRPPIPVVVPKFKDRRPLLRVASEFLERSSNTAFDLSDINSVMTLLRDDLAVVGRGCSWVRYETKGESETESERIVVEHIDRKDFLHDPARKWSDVDWVARRAYLTRVEMKDRFGDVWARAAYEVQRKEKDRGAANGQQKAAVWEIWCKSENRVVWVTEGVDELLDEGKPHLKLEGFFPCPQPVYATVQRGSLVPVPDMLFYKDQLEEVNELTGRIHALSEAVQVRGFYPAGAGEIGDAIQTALKSYDNRQVMVPVSNWAAFGSGSAKDTIVWLPTDMVATTIGQLVELRRQIIEDVYQIMGLSDIMRGQTDTGPKKTATEQNLKAQFGSVRIRDKQFELIRVSRDIVRLAAEIMAENFAQKTLLEMSQMQIPTEAEIAAQSDAIMQQAQQQFQQQVQQALQNPEMAQQAQQNPQQAQQMAGQLQQQIVGQAQSQIEKLKQQPTIEAVMKLLRDQRIRPFVLDIETDSTIQPDEDAEKQRRAEFLTALGGTMQQLAGLVQMEPSAAGFAAEVLKFAVAPFRAGRDLEGAIEEFADQMAQRASNPPPDPAAEQAKAEAEAEGQRIQAEMQMKMQELQAKLQIEREKMQADMQAKQFDAQIKQQENAAKIEQINAQMRRDEQKGALEVQKLQMEIEANAAELQMKAEGAQMDAAIRQQEAAQRVDQSERAFQQKSALADQQRTQESR